MSFVNYETSITTQIKFSIPSLHVHSCMPLYYLNTEPVRMEFFTDAGTIREALLIADRMELVRLKSYYGLQDLKHRYKTISKGKASPELKLMMDWMPADMVLSRLYEHRLQTKSFFLETDCGTTIHGTTNGEIVISFSEQECLEIIFDTFLVPQAVRKTLLTNPGVLYQTNRRSQRFISEGYFKSIWSWIDQEVIESVAKSTEMNMN